MNSHEPSLRTFSRQPLSRRYSECKRMTRLRASPSFSLRRSARRKLRLAPAICPSGPDHARNNRHGICRAPRQLARDERDVAMECQRYTSTTRLALDARKPAEAGADCEETPATTTTRGNDSRGAADLSDSPAAGATPERLRSCRDGGGSRRGEEGSVGAQHHNGWAIAALCFPIFSPRLS